MGFSIANQQAMTKVSYFYKLLDQKIVRARLAMHNGAVADKLAQEPAVRSLEEARALADQALMT